MGERTCGSCKKQFLLNPEDKKGRVVCSAPLPLLASSVVYVRQMITAQDTDATECECFERRDEKGGQGG